MTSASWSGTTTGFLSFVRAVAASPVVDPDLAARHRRLAEGGVVIDGSYHVLGEIGRGGLGRVYRARDLELGREVAIKVLRLDASAAAIDSVSDLLEREAVATACLNHPNIVTVYRYGVWEEMPFLVLELLDGESLAQHLARGPISVDEAVRTTDQILAGLEHAHRLGVLHRDLSPRNVFLRRDGVVKLLDFGLSSLRGGSVGFRAAPGETILGAGTPGYMSPEQQRGEAPDARSDLWAVGALFQQMLGERSAGRPVAEYIVRACADDPTARFPDASAMRTALPWPQRAASERRRRRLITATAVVTLVGAASAVAWSTDRGGAERQDLAIDLMEGFPTSPAEPGSQIVNVSSGKCLDVIDAGRDLAEVNQDNCHGGDSQRWVLWTPRETTDAVLIHQRSWLCVDVPSASMEDGTVLVLYPCHAGGNQRFRRIKTADGVLLQSVQSHKCVSAPDGNRASPAEVHQDRCDGGDLQRWRIVGLATTRRH